MPTREEKALLAEQLRQRSRQIMPRKELRWLHMVANKMRELGADPAAVKAWMDTGEALLSTDDVSVPTIDTVRQELAEQEEEQEVRR